MARGTRAKTPPQWSVVKSLFHLRIKDAAARLGFSESYLKKFCRKNGLPRWPREKIRFQIDKIRILKMEVAARQYAQPGDAGHRPPIRILQDITKAREDLNRILECSIPPPALQEQGGSGTTAVSLRGNIGSTTESKTGSLPESNTAA